MSDAENRLAVRRLMGACFAGVPTELLPELAKAALAESRARDTTARVICRKKATGNLVWFGLTKAGGAGISVGGICYSKGEVLLKHGGSSSALGTPPPITVDEAIALLAGIPWERPALMEAAVVAQLGERTQELFECGACPFETVSTYSMALHRADTGHIHPAVANLLPAPLPPATE